MVVENLYSESAMVAGLTIPRTPFLGLSANVSLSVCGIGMIPVIAGSSESTMDLSIGSRREAMPGVVRRR